MASSKWKLHKFYSRDAIFRKFLPDTALLNQTTLKQFLDSYQSVYIKPDTRHGGNGIIQAQKTENGYSYSVVKGRNMKRETNLSSIEVLYRKIKAHAIDDTYIIQKAISLAKIDDRSYDIRSMMMRKPGGKWEFYGYFAKVAGAVSIITNVCRSGGYVITIEKALQQSLGLNSTEIEKIKQTMLQLSHQICNRFNAYKSTTTQIGIDFALDTQGKIWIIEINFDLPSHSGNSFAKLPDKTNYYRIQKMKAFLKARKGKKLSSVKRLQEKG